jgi:UMF1 family MFS transporter
MQGNKKTILGWALYDWANSAFATTVMAGFFPIFFKQFWSQGVDTTISTARLGLANSIAGITVALLAPLLGAIADKGSAKKKFLFFFAFLGAIMSLSLSMVAQGNWPAAVILYALATIGFSGGNIFYDSLIVSVAPKEKMDMVSSLGYSLGYLGGGILFAFNVWMVLFPSAFGLADASEAIKLSFILVGFWWAIFTIPILVFVKEPSKEKTLSLLATIKAGVSQLRQTFSEVRHLKTIFLFLVACWFYLDGVDTIIRMAIDYGLSIGFKSNDLILALLLVQFIGFPAALLFGYLGTKFNTKAAIFIAIAVYLFISIWGAFMQHKQEFYIIAIMIGLVQGGIQALSRSFYARIIPSDKSAEYFGFYNMLGKFAVIIGPILMGSVGLFVKSLGYSSIIASRVSITSISILFIIGAVLLFFVDEKKGREQALHLSQKP